MVQLLLALVAVLALPALAFADQGVTTSQATGAGLVAFLYGTVCALWALQTKRSPIAWFIVGVIFTVLAAMAMLFQAGRDRKTQEAPTW